MTSFASSRAIPLLTVASLLFATTTIGVTITEPTTELCGQFQAISTKDGEYIFNNNAWNEDDSGAQCTNVLESGSSFNSIWSWTANGNNTHSFPNVQLNSQEILPLPMTELAAVNLQATWSLTQEGGLSGDTRANIVYDLFFDTDAETSSNASTAEYEMMIWLGAFNDPFPLGASINPFGVVNNSLTGVVVGGTNFTLFSGVNSGGQTVHSWVSTSTNVTDFSGDAAPLVNYLTTNKLVKSGTFLGLIQFGSETWHATSNVTFTASSFNLNVTSTNATANALASSAIAFAATATATSGSSPSASASVSSPSSADSSSSTAGTPSSPSSTSEGSSSVTIPLISSAPTLTLASSTFIVPPNSIIPLSSITTITETKTAPSLTTTSPGSSTATGSSTSGSSSSSSSGAKSGSSIISLPFWFWEIAAAGSLFAMI